MPRARRHREPRHPRAGLVCGCATCEPTRCSSRADLPAECPRCDFVDVARAASDGAHRRRAPGRAARAGARHRRVIRSGPCGRPLHGQGRRRQDDHGSAAAVCAAERGRRTLVASADAAHSWATCSRRRLGPETTSSRRAARSRDRRARRVAQALGSDQTTGRQLLYHGVDAVVAEELAMMPGAEEIVTCWPSSGWRHPAPTITS